LKRASFTPVIFRESSTKISMYTENLVHAFFGGGSVNIAWLELSRE